MGGETCEANCHSRTKNELLPHWFPGQRPCDTALTFFETTCYKSNRHLGGEMQFGPWNSASASQPSSPRAARTNTIKSICHCPSLCVIHVQAICSSTGNWVFRRVPCEVQQLRGGIDGISVGINWGWFCPWFWSPKTMLTSLSWRNNSKNNKGQLLLLEKTEWFTKSKGTK